MSRETLEQPGYQPAKAHCGIWSDELTANFGEPELGVIVPVSETTNIWFGRTGLEDFLTEVDAGRGDIAQPPRLLQVHIWPIRSYDEWPQLEKLVGAETTARLQQLHQEALAKPVIDTRGLDETEILTAISQTECQSEFQAPHLSLLQVADIILTARDLHEGRTGN